jgi:proline dehydrogenase
MITRSALIWLSRHEGLKDFATRFKFFKKLTTRFVAGDTIEEVIPYIQEINAENGTASFDHLNESVESAAEAEREVEEYLNILAAIDKHHIRSNVSIKLTQFGLGLDSELAYRNARRVVEEAHRRGNFVRVDMEDSKVTQVTIDIFKRLRAEFGLNDVGEVAFADKKDVDANYVKVMQLLLASGTYHGIATHDPKMIDATINFAGHEGIGKEKYEFQMLYGIRRDLQRQLARDGFNLRIYVPYGKHWYPYFMRRLAERPANIWFVLKNLAKG